ncbi:hypothetical protein VNI00_013260 [Paramarasmius palmivorus]|uniref:Transmembrane protein n=1 Tax=Paramarasmius palmivorus TaxID=297713 RepID=A0AAW0BZ35_9AGAR
MSKFSVKDSELPGGSGTHAFLTSNEEAVKEECVDPVLQSAELSGNTSDRRCTQESSMTSRFWAITKLLPRVVFCKMTLISTIAFLVFISFTQTADLPPSLHFGNYPRLVKVQSKELQHIVLASERLLTSSDMIERVALTVKPSHEVGRSVENLQDTVHRAVNSAQNFRSLLERSLESLLIGNGNTLSRIRAVTLGYPSLHYLLPFYAFITRTTWFSADAVIAQNFFGSTISLLSQVRALELETRALREVFAKLDEELSTIHDQAPYLSFTNVTPTEISSSDFWGCSASCPLGKISVNEPFFICCLQQHNRMVLYYANSTLLALDRLGNEVHEMNHPRHTPHITDIRSNSEALTRGVDDLRSSLGILRVEETN